MVVGFNLYIYLVSRWCNSFLLKQKEIHFLKILEVSQTHNNIKGGQNKVDWRVLFESSWKITNEQKAKSTHAEDYDAINMESRIGPKDCGSGKQYLPIQILKWISDEVNRNKWSMEFQGNNLFFSKGRKGKWQQTTSHSLIPHFGCRSGVYRLTWCWKKLEGT